MRIIRRQGRKEGAIVDRYFINLVKLAGVPFVILMEDTRHQRAAVAVATEEKDTRGASVIRDLRLEVHVRHGRLNREMKASSKLIKPIYFPFSETARWIRPS